MQQQQQQINPDLVSERRKASFPINEVTNLFNGVIEKTREWKKLEELVVNDRAFDFDFNSYGHGEEEHYQTTLATGKHFLDVLHKNKITYHGMKSMYPIGTLQNFACPLNNPFTTHTPLFTPVMYHWATDEQRDFWMSLIYKGEVTGSLVQTELGHGSNYQRVETTATFDPKTDEFVIHSPTRTSMKIWPGGLARASSHGLVMARLCIDGKSYGVHGFMLPLRNKSNGSALPGITMGEIGPKMNAGYNNGFLKVNQVRIPRTYMLMRHSQVLRDGTFVKAKNPFAQFLPIIVFRYDLGIYLANVVGQSVTIAIRHGAVRRQGNDPEDRTREIKLLDYNAVQNRLVPLLATAYAGKLAYQLNYDTMMNTFTGNPEPQTIAEVHALSAGLKGFFCGQSAHAASECILACGGFGFLQASHLPFLHSVSMAASIYEGENSIMLLQTAKYLLRACQDLQKGEQLAPSVAYFGTKRMAGVQTVTLADFVAAFQTTTTKLAEDCLRKIESRVMQGVSLTTAFNDNGFDGLQCAVMHVKTFVLSNATEYVSKTTNLCSPETRRVLEKLLRVVAIHWIQQSARMFLQFGGLTVEQLTSLNDQLTGLLSDLRPDLVALVDAFNFSDQELCNSINGCYDGQTYDRTLNYLDNVPYNKNQRNYIPLASKSRL